MLYNNVADTVMRYIPINKHQFHFIAIIIIMSKQQREQQLGSSSMSAEAAPATFATTAAGRHQNACKLHPTHMNDETTVINICIHFCGANKRILHSAYIFYSASHNHPESITICENGRKCIRMNVCARNNEMNALHAYLLSNITITYSYSCMLSVFAHTHTRSGNHYK